MNWQQIALLIGLAGIGFGLVWRGFVGASHKFVRAALVTQPPKHLRPAEVGLLLHGKLGGRELVASIMDLSGRGVVEFGADALLAGSKTLSLRLVKHSQAGLSATEKLLLQTLFTGKLVDRDLNKVSEEAVARLTIELQNTASSELGDEDLFAQPPRTRRYNSMFVGFVVICVIGLAVYGLNYVLPQAVSVVFALSGLGFGLWSLSSFRLRPKGLHELEEVEGFRQYLISTSKAAKPGLYAGYLGYAYELGVQQQWSRKCGVEFNAALVGKLEKIFNQV